MENFSLSESKSELENTSSGLTTKSCGGFYACAEARQDFRISLVVFAASTGIFGLNKMLVTT
jgi:hypothetical protein